MTGAQVVASLRGVEVHYPAPGAGRRRVRAVDGVDLDIHVGEALGLIGESGCGKSSLGRAVVRLSRPTAGEIRFGGRDIARVRGGRALRQARDGLQMVFQDPATSLDPRLHVVRSVAEPLRARTPAARREALGVASRMLERVGLGAEIADRYPHQLSGGQAQRAAIARALVARPRLIVLDEPVSALDVSVQAQIVNLLAELQAELGVAYLFIAHDLAVVRQLCPTIAIMYLGRIVELGDREQIFSSPAHPYTKALLSAVPVPDPGRRDRRRIVLEGEAPSASEPPRGCRFHTRCWKATERCAVEEPALVRLATGQTVACHYPEVELPPPPASPPHSVDAPRRPGQPSTDQSPSPTAQPRPATGASARRFT